MAEHEFLQLCLAGGELQLQKRPAPAAGAVPKGPIPSVPVSSPFPIISPS